MDAAGFSATFAGISSLAAITTAAVATRSLRSQRQDSRDRTRPLVVASFRTGPEMTSLGALYLTIRNSGASVARQVRVTFDPALPTDKTTPAGSPAQAGPYITKRYAEPIPMLTPGEGLNNLYLSLAKRDEPVPDDLTVSVSYTDDRGREFSDTFSLRTSIYGPESRQNPGGDKYDKRTAVATEAAVWEAWHTRGS